MHPKNIQVFDFNERPFLVIWESTKACDLACVHCRASADPVRAPDELTTAEAKQMLDDVKSMRTPVFVFSGGDAMKREDIFELIGHSKKIGLRTGVIPAVTRGLTYEKIRELKTVGVDQLAFSLDATTAAEHDAFRRVEGVFDHTLECLEWAKSLGLPVQINSLINVHNTEKIDDLIDLIEKFGIVFWEVFFLVPVGRGAEIEMLAAEKFEAAFEKLYALNKRVKFIIKVTEAPHYRRYCIQQEMRKDGIDPKDARTQAIRLPEYLKRREGLGGSIGMAPQGVNSGKGFVFVSHQGEVYPSGFLPISVGNVRRTPLPELYRTAPLMRELRDTSLLKGRCGICAYKEVCGGSRSRAYALTGDWLAEDPCCIFQPQPATV